MWRKSMAYNWKKNRNMVVVLIWKNRTIFFSSKRSNWQHREQKLEELTMKIEDVEALVDEVADIAYDKAVEVVADTVKLETHKEDIKLVE